MGAEKLFAVAVVLLVVVFMFSIPLIPEQVEKPDITYQPVSFTGSMNRIYQATKFPWFTGQFPWIFGELTRAEYTLKNTDNQSGKFIVTFTFNNEKVTNIVDADIFIAAGHSQVIARDSNLRGKSTVNVDVTPSQKSIVVMHKETINVSVFDKLGIRALDFVFRRSVFG